MLSTCLPIFPTKQYLTKDWKLTAQEEKKGENMIMIWYSLLSERGSNALNVNVRNKKESSWLHLPATIEFFVSYLLMELIIFNTTQFARSRKLIWHDIFRRLQSWINNIDLKFKDLSCYEYEWHERKLKFPCFLYRNLKNKYGMDSEII